MFAGIELRPGIVRVSAVAKATCESLRERVHIQHHERGPVFGRRRRKTQRPRNRSVRLLVSIPIYYSRRRSLIGNLVIARQHGSYAVSVVAIERAVVQNVTKAISEHVTFIFLNFQSFY